ncbi:MULTISPECIES: NifB/NifX family molybdenum-iron cluster-binding protein [unclassified Lentimicrobium]|uniref:NifB/NifX family molybdenum-iron cluster-binding protein n=1 Tax=unclassified Lentimicrobium TaxID=2677434 RepID=UPI001557DCD2|nr:MULTISPECIES: NifB/NifX family molybdenum-iron cluster-binding protein [unclassified Lentimicrobium]NPD44016.1 dinitrogenase iron-molybdenum cofactor biosynthesis protein [Lentimicrobium sp. S6]NPD84070.1 dinitrogenase iron-molybdenum cofactor biosynthesis protein [Lentimicrobium sp. L6]
MKIAIPTRGNIVDGHFGHCEAYTIITVDNNKKIEKTEILPSPQGCGCKSNIASVLKDLGVTVMLAGNMGNGALNVLHQQGIEVVRGCQGDILLVAQAYLDGNIGDSGISCQQHEAQGEGHVCNH